jgi:urease accessory protein
VLHGGEAPVDGSAMGWWAGALAASLLVGGGSFLAMRRLPLVWTTRLALLLAVLGGALALVPLAAQAG